MWAIHYNVTILITFKTPDVGTISCYVSFFLVLKTVILIVWHHVDHRWWSDGGSQLLYHIKLFDFGYCIAECLWSFFLCAGGQTVGIHQCSNPLMNILNVAASFVKLHLFNFCLELMYICSKGLLFSLLDLHES